MDDRYEMTRSDVHQYKYKVVFVQSRSVYGYFKFKHLICGIYSIVV